MMHHHPPYLNFGYSLKQKPFRTRPALPCLWRALALETKVSTRELIWLLSWYLSDTADWSQVSTTEFTRRVPLM